uniref:H15 domain-containing protein n=1 Tax=Globodera rostochiensis TaxID=31243 RepID=A0A914IH96_GLORO
MRPPPTHPPYIQMIKHALAAKNVSSREAIFKFIVAHYDVGKSQARAYGYMNKALTRAVASGGLKQVKGVEASGSFSAETKPTSTKCKTMSQNVVKTAATKKLKPSWTKELKQEALQLQKVMLDKKKKDVPSEQQQQQPISEGKKRRKKKNRSGAFKRARKNLNVQKQKQKKQ